MPVGSIQNGRQIGAGRLVIETDGHECPLVDQPQTAIQAPAEHIVVARRNKESWPGESWRSADQRFQIFVAFADCMSEQADLGGVAGDAAKMPDYGSRVARNRVDQFGAAI